MAFDILGVIPDGEVEVSARVIRPGRTIELLEAELTAAGRVVVRATAWRLAVSDTSTIAGGDIPEMPGPAAGTAPGWARTCGRAASSARLEFRVLPGGSRARGRVWLRTDVDLVDGEPSSPLARFFG